MRRTGTSKPTVWRWLDRFLAEGVDGLPRDRPHRRGNAPVPASAAQALADAQGMAVSTVHRILKRHGLKPRQVRTFKVSNDPRSGVNAVTSSACT